MSSPALRAIFRPCNFRARQCAFRRTPQFALRSFTSSAFLRNEERDRPRPKLSERIQQRLPESIRNKLPDTIRENIYTIPNALTMSRIIACPFLGWAIVESNFTVATALLAYAGLTDLVRAHYPSDVLLLTNSQGGRLDSAKIQNELCSWYHLGPRSGQDTYDNPDRNISSTRLSSWCVPAYCSNSPLSLTLILVPLAVIIVGRDVLLSLSAFWIRYTSLPAPVGVFSTSFLC